MRKDRENDKKNNNIITNTTFSINGLPIECVKEFKYLGRYLSEDDNDWKAINWNIKRARISWGRLARILSTEKATSKSMASIYKAVVQGVLLYSSESWTLTSSMCKK